MKTLLTNLATAATLLALGFTAGYLLCQTDTINRADEVISQNPTHYYDAYDLTYIAIGERPGRP